MKQTTAIIKDTMKEMHLTSAKFLWVIFVILLLCFSFTPKFTEAAFLYFDPLSADLYKGDTISLNLRLDTDEGECINTVDAVINYDNGIKAVDVSRGDSILSVWVESPVIDEDTRTIRFAGGIPGGYCGRIPGDPQLTNVIATIVFRSPGFTVGGNRGSSANVIVESNSQVLLHDGLGTPAPLRTQGASITLLDIPGNTQSDAWRQQVSDDNEPPSDFSITLTKDDVAFGGRYFIVFNSLDKQSGIDHYEVFEEPFSEFWSFNWGRADAPWKRAESPYILEDQTLNSTIWVKAIDKAGNERITKLVPDHALSTLSRNSRIVLMLVISFGVLLLGLVGYALIRRRNRVASNNISDDNE